MGWDELPGLFGAPAEHVGMHGGAFADSTASAVTVTRIMQRKSKAFRDVWATYCATNGGGRNDPNKHDASFHVEFWDCLAQQATGMVADPSALAAMSLTVEPPPKRAKTDRPAQAAPVGPADPAKDLLVEQIKIFQQLGDLQKEAWWEHCDLNLGGMRDPSRHDASVLQNFVIAYGVYKAVAGRTSHDADPLKASLVARIKQYQRVDKSQLEAWYGFCGEIRDPGRHTAEELEEFVRVCSVP